MLQDRVVAVAPKPQARRGGLLKKRRFLIGGLVVLTAMVVLMVVAFQGASVYYLTVAELKGMGGKAYGQPIRVTAWVTADPVAAEPANMVLRFTVSNAETGGDKMPVFYKGVVPDGFKTGAEVVVEGQYNSSGVFEANKLLTKCPSKYEAADQGS